MKSFTTTINPEPQRSIVSIFVSDVHTGHRKTETELILANLTREFLEDERVLMSVDYFFINGDFFDRQLSLSDPVVHLIAQWIDNFLRACKYHGVKVRILEGTPLHDWRQSEMFVTINQTSQIGCDLKYFKDLTIDYEEADNLHILYIPDEYKSGPEDAWNDTLRLMAELNIRQVDYAMMHGFFPHQLPSHAHGAHNPDDYQRITRCAISIGHVHTASNYGKIFAQGSFDRTGHGYESDKGYYRITDSGIDGPLLAEFKVNKGAKIYRTIDCRDLGIEDFFERIEREPAYPVGSHLCVFCRKDDAGSSAIPVLTKRYPQYNWSLKKEKVNATVRDAQEVLFKRVNSVTMTKDNARHLLEPYILSKASDSMIADRCLKLIEETILHERY